MIHQPVCRESQYPEGMRDPADSRHNDHRSVVAKRPRRILLCHVSDRAANRNARHSSHRQNQEPLPALSRKPTRTISHRDTISHSAQRDTAPEHHTSPAKLDIPPRPGIGLTGSRLVRSDTISPSLRGAVRESGQRSSQSCSRDSNVIPPQPQVP